MEADILQTLPQEEQTVLLPVAFSNLSYFYYRRGKFATALRYMQRAEALERRVRRRGPPSLAICRPRLPLSPPPPHVSRRTHLHHPS